ncbi:hypothetical protein C465_09190 [Halorubrum distributum JCM 9100]|uniref:DUF8080 domain-containing protein n=2 Tax=Halorubrum distributum TaxID=29283 RepID=M0ELT1_9EURY|nr:hypothetical protein [Halorubrum distributum]ELZ48746.1 hypothetical protein C465_09190 [Halorubrum distributum JCM 9100]ELZ51860.1 hypothetical protein C466_13080 [Halorubrum distributum JCM 10118]
MELDWSVDREGDASLVGVRVRNDGAVPRRVRIESRLDGPVLPPRRGGVPESGWDAGGVTRVIDPGDRAAFGFAALADPVEPPVEIASVEPLRGNADDGRGSAEDGSDLARAAVRDLESHRPPRRAVARAEPGDDEAGSDGEAADRDGEERPGNEESTGSDGGATRSAAPHASPSAAGPDEIDAWFAAVEARIERAERLADADLATATAVVEEAGGLDAVGGLDERVAADAERLKAVRDRAAALAERAEESEVPTEALEALA